MNSIENEQSVRNLEMMVGPNNMAGDSVRSVPTQEPEEPEFVVETFHIDPNGEMFVTRPGSNSDNT